MFTWATKCAVICYSTSREVTHLPWTVALHYLFPAPAATWSDSLFVCLLVCCLRPPVEPKSHEGRHIVLVTALLPAAPRAGLWLCTVCEVTQGPANSLPDTSCCKCDDSFYHEHRKMLSCIDTDRLWSFSQLCLNWRCFLLPRFGMFALSQSNLPPSFVVGPMALAWVFCLPGPFKLSQQWGWLFQMRRTEQR